MVTNNASGQLDFQGFQFPTTTPVPDEVFDILMYHLSGNDLKVLLYICRRTFGFKKDNDNISLNQMLTGITTKEGKVLDRGTGLSKPTLLRSVRSLENSGVIVRIRRQSAEKGNEPTNYRLNFLAPLGKKMILGGDQNFTKPLVKERYPQQTVLQETEVQQDVVVRQALQNFGISKSGATKLAQDYPEELILEKLSLAQWLTSTGAPAVSKNPSGWLRKAIEEDYAPPKNFESPREKKAKSEEDVRLAERETKERQVMEAEFHRVRAETKEQLLEQYPAKPVGGGLDTHSAWELALGRLKDEVGLASYETWLKDTVLLSVTDRVAEIAVASPYIGAWIERKLYKEIAGTLKKVLSKDLDLRFLTITSSVPA